MAQSGYTPISLYYSATGAAVPTAGNLVAGELALNTNDGKLYYKNSSGVVTLLAGATAGPAGGSTTQVQYNNAGVLAGITGATTNGTALTLVAPVLGTPASGTVTNLTGTASININGTVGATTANTGAFTTLSATQAITASLSGLALTVPNGYQTLYRTTNDTSSLLHLQFFRGTGAGAYAGIFTTGDAANGVASLNLNIDGTNIAKVSSAGLAVTGTLSATGTLSGGTSGTGYSFDGSAPAGSLSLISGGRFGIGMSLPAYKLDVDGAINSSNDIISQGANARLSLYRSAGVNYFDWSSGQDLYFSTQTSAGGAGRATKMVLDASGNLGIGTSSPASFAGTTNLVVGGGSGNSVLTLYGGASTYSGVYFADGASGSDRYRGFFEYNHSTDSLTIGTAASTKATLESGGNLGIGTSSPSQKLEVAGTIKSTATGASFLASGTTAAARYAQIVNDGSANGILFGTEGTTAGGILSGTSSYSGIIAQTANLDLALGTNGTARLIINGAGRIQMYSTISVGSATPATTGSGITFPATQSASSDANTLDDYEEGTWTPDQGSGLTVVGAFSSIGRYTKIGNMVTVWGQVTGATSIAVSAIGFITTNLPFAIQTDIGAQGIATGFWTSMNSATHISVGATTSVYSAQAISGSTTIGFTTTYRF